MIIGINGRIGVGKDLTGKIIQYLTANEEVKRLTTLEEWLESDDLNGRDYHWKIKKFAGKLKTIASLLTGIPVEDFEDQEFKKTLLGEEWGTIRPNPLNAIPVFEDIQFNELMSVRELLQKLGTEAMRDALHENVWVNALFADYKITRLSMSNSVEEISKQPYPNWIITDMRFPNEMEAVVERKGITIRVVRPCSECGGIGYHKMSCSKQYQKEHPSETSLDDAEFKYTVINDGSIDDLIEKVRQILITEKII